MSESGRIVIDLPPSLKRELHSALRQDGLKLKHWFEQKAREYCDSRDSNVQQPTSSDTNNVETPLLGPELTSSFSVVSLFSGCGGMDLGFTGGFNFLGQTYAKNPFRIVWSNDINEAACRTYRENFESVIHCGDVYKQLHTLPESADVVIGGFPCQDISVNGLRKGIKGERSGLYRAMVEVVDRVRPRVFVAENVKGLLLSYNRESLLKVISDFEGLGYSLNVQLYQAADYGVPQSRERVIIVGVEGDHNTYVPPQKLLKKTDWIPVDRAIGDLIASPENPEFSHIWSRAKRSPDQGSRVLVSHRPGQTIRAECHGNIQWHYKLPRRLSMREAARIQSFPDEFRFAAKLRETERMIGNAVPPVLAWHVARSITNVLVAPVEKDNLMDASQQRMNRLAKAIV